MLRKIVIALNGTFPHCAILHRDEVVFTKYSVKLFNTTIHNEKVDLAEFCKKWTRKFLNSLSLIFA